MMKNKINYSTFMFGRKKEKYILSSRSIPILGLEKFKLFSIKCYFLLKLIID